MAGMIWHFSKDLPDYSQLQDYEPPVMTRVHASRRLAAWANTPRSDACTCRSRRFPKLVINAFLAAEDKNFYEHGGIDYTGMARAALVYIAELRFQPPSAGRVHHHPAGCEELPL